MKAAYDVGINFFDCAEGKQEFYFRILHITVFDFALPISDTILGYSGGESERVMGQAIKKYGWKRNDLVISTKVTSPLFVWY